MRPHVGGRDPRRRRQASFATIDAEAVEDGDAAATAATIRGFMVQVVDSAAPAPRRRSPASTVAGKTGTAQTGEGAAPHAWFIGFAPGRGSRGTRSR